MRRNLFLSVLLVFSMLNVLSIHSKSNIPEQATTKTTITTTASITATLPSNRLVETIFSFFPTPTPKPERHSTYRGDDGKDDGDRPQPGTSRPEPDHTPAFPTELPTPVPTETVTITPTHTPAWPTSFNPGGQPPDAKPTSTTTTEISGTPIIVPSDDIIYATSVPFSPLPTIELAVTPTLPVQEQRQNEPALTSTIP